MHDADIDIRPAKIGQAWHVYIRHKPTDATVETSGKHLGSVKREAFKKLERLLSGGVRRCKCGQPANRNSPICGAEACKTTRQKRLTPKPTAAEKAERAVSVKAATIECRPHYEPSAEEIAKACEELRRKWPDPVESAQSIRLTRVYSTTPATGRLGNYDFVATEGYW